jgi:hypothetical protein
VKLCTFVALNNTFKTASKEVPEANVFKNPLVYWNVKRHHSLVLPFL